MLLSVAAEAVAITGSAEALTSRCAPEVSSEFRSDLMAGPLDAHPRPAFVHAASQSWVNAADMLMPAAMWVFKATAFQKQLYNARAAR